LCRLTIIALYALKIWNKNFVVKTETVVVRRKTKRVSETRWKRVICTTKTCNLQIGVDKMSAFISSFLHIMLTLPANIALF